MIRDVLYDSKTTRQVALVAQNSLAQIGVNLQIDAKPGTGFFTNYVIPATSTSPSSPGVQTHSHWDR